MPVMSRARYNDLTNNKVGNSKYSDLSVFSFHPAKNITTERWNGNY